jgi:MFS family permease
VLLSPVAGALVDRWDRRRAMMISVVGAGACALGMVALVGRQPLPIVPIYALLAASACFQSLRWPALASSVTVLVAKRHYGRASGLLQLGLSAAQALAPLVAAVLVVRTGLRGVALAEVAVSMVALLVLLPLAIPAPQASAEGSRSRGSLAAEIRSGWLYIRERPGLFGLLVLFVLSNFAMGMVVVLLQPMVLGFADLGVLSKVMSVASAGLILGGVAMAVWGGPRRRLSGILVAIAVQGLALIAAGARPQAVPIAAAAFVFLGAFAVISACSQALWQSKVPADLQGRVFALRRTVALVAVPLASLLAGPLADHVFEPLLARGGALAASLGPWIGTGAGRGVALLAIVLGVLVLAVAAAGAASRALRSVEELADAVEEVPPATASLASSSSRATRL